MSQIQMRVKGALSVLFLFSALAAHEDEPAWVAMRGARISGVVRPVDATLGSQHRLYIASSVAGKVEGAVETACVTQEGDVL